MVQVLMYHNLCFSYQFQEISKKRDKIFSRKCKIQSYQEARVNLANTQISKLKTAAKNIQERFRKKNNKKKNFEDEEYSHELFLTTTQTTKTRKGFANNMLTNIKFRKNSNT